MEVWYFIFKENIYKKRYSNRVLPKTFYGMIPKLDEETEDEYLDRLWETFRV